MQRDHFFEVRLGRRSTVNPTVRKPESFGDANSFDDVGVFGSVDARSDEAERETKSRRRLKLVHAAAKEFSVGLQENFAARSGDRIRKFRNLRMLERLDAANPDQRRNGFDFRQRIGNSGIDHGPQNQRLAVARARDTGGDSKLEV